jgi:hypothetical protein
MKNAKLIEWTAYHIVSIHSPLENTECKVCWGACATIQNTVYDQKSDNILIVNNIETNEKI